MANAKRRKPKCTGTAFAPVQASPSSTLFRTSGSSSSAVNTVGHCIARWLAMFTDTGLPAAFTIVTNERMQAHLVEIVTLGFTLDEETNDAGERCISVPVMVASTGVAREQTTEIPANSFSSVTQSLNLCPSPKKESSVLVHTWRYPHVLLSR